MGDPEFLGPGKFHLDIAGIDTESPAFEAAQEACGDKLPELPGISASVASVGTERAGGRRRWPALRPAGAARGGGRALLAVAASAPAGLRRRRWRRPERDRRTGTVERRTLAERLTATGTIGYAGETTVLARLAGTVTALPAVGDVVRRGGRLYAVDGRAGAADVRDGPGLPGPGAKASSAAEDVEQLERNLAALGYEPGSVDERLHRTRPRRRSPPGRKTYGLEASGEVELGRVAFLRGPQRVTGLEATLGEALSGGSGGEAGSEGESEPASTPVLRTSSTRRVVSVELEADQQSIAHRGQQVEVVLPGGAEAPGGCSGLAAVERVGRRRRIGRSRPGDRGDGLADRRGAGSRRSTGRRSTSSSPSGSARTCSACRSPR